MGLPSALARLALAALLVPPSIAQARMQDPAPTVQSLTRSAVKLRAEAEAAEERHSPEAASKYAEAASAWDRALMLERETEATWERRHSIFCDASAAWQKAFDLGLRSLPQVKQAARAAQDYSDGLRGYPDQGTREPTCKARDRLEHANQLLAAEEAQAAEQTEEPAKLETAAPKLEAIQGSKDEAPSEPRGPAAAEPVPGWQFGLLSTFALLSIGGAVTAGVLGARVHQGATLDKSGELYRELFAAVAASGVPVHAGDALCSDMTRADSTVDGLCRTALHTRQGMITAAVLSGVFLVGTGVLAGVVGKRQASRRAALPRAGVAWRPGGATLHLQMSF